MIQIRNNVFETNSSSTHTLVFHKLNPKINIKDYTPFEIYGGYYGRCPTYPLTTIEEKLNYLWQAIWDNYGFFFDFDLQEYNTNKKILNEWKDAIHFYCPNAVFHDIDPDDFEKGIDHSYYVKPLLEEMQKNMFLLKDYLFDSDGYIIITGDEYEKNDESEFFDPNSIPKINWKTENTETLYERKDKEKPYYLYVKSN